MPRVRFDWCLVSMHRRVKPIPTPINSQPYETKKLTLAGGVVALCLSASAPAWGAAAISVNYDVTVSSTPALATTDVAGVVPVDHWNNLQALGFGQPFNYGMTYVDNSGANTTLTVAASSGVGDSWNTPGIPDEIIFGDKSAFSGGTQTLTLSNIPYATFDLYIYVSEWSNEVVNFTIGANTQTVTNTFTPQFTEGPNFVQNDTYVMFTGLSGNTVVNMLPTSGGLHLGGFQIVEGVTQALDRSGLLAWLLRWPCAAAAPEIRFLEHSIKTPCGNPRGPCLSGCC